MPVSREVGSKLKSVLEGYRLNKKNGIPLLLMRHVQFRHLLCSRCKIGQTSLCLHCSMTHFLANNHPWILISMVRMWIPSGSNKAQFDIQLRPRRQPVSALQSPGYIHFLFRLLLSFNTYLHSSVLLTKLLYFISSGAYLADPLP